MNITLGTYHVVPETVLRNEVMGYHGFLDRATLVAKENDLNGLLDIYRRFLEAGCPSASPEWFDGETVTKERALEVYDMLCQILFVVQEGIAFADSPAGKMQARRDELRREFSYLERTLYDIGGRCGKENERGLLNQIQNVEEQLEEMERDAAEEGRGGFWRIDGESAGEEYMDYEVGVVWRAIMGGLGRTSAAVLA